MESPSDVNSACFGLVPAAPGRPVQAVSDGVFALVNEVEKSTDFGEGERDQASMSGWRGSRSGWITGWIVLLYWRFGLFSAPFLAVYAMMVRKVWASMARVICRCQASQVRTW